MADSAHSTCRGFSFIYKILGDSRVKKRDEGGRLHASVSTNYAHNLAIKISHLFE